MKNTCITYFASTLFYVILIFSISVPLTSQVTHYALGWTVNNNADWTPFPNNANPLGSGTGNCTGGTNSNGWAEFSFPNFNSSGSITGIELCVKYLSASGTNEAVLKQSGMNLGSKILPIQGGNSSCNNTVENCMGGMGDLWSSGLTSGNNLSVRINQNSNTLDIDFVKLTIWFSGDNTDPDCNGANIPNQIANASCEATISGDDVIGVTDSDGDQLTINVNPSTLSLGPNLVTVSVEDGNGGSCNININVNVDDDSAPVPDIANLPDATGECSVTVTPPTATDNCEGSIIATTNDPLSYMDQGTFNIMWTYVDGNENTSNQSQDVIVNDITPPLPDIANLPDATGECDVTVTPPTATDNCKGTIMATTDDPLTYMNQGTFNIMWTYDDGNGNTSIQHQEVIVDDITPPVITTTGNTIEMWPPNHKYTAIHIADCVVDVSDNCNMDLTLADVQIVEVSSDEPEDVKGKGGGGDGNTMNDILISGDCQSVQLRAERRAKGNGRVYSIHFTLDDGNDNTGTASCQVTVPRSQSSGPALDDGVGEGYSEECHGSTVVHNESEFSRLKSLHLENVVLEQNRPNPFAAITYINFIVPQRSDVSLSVFNLQGQLVRTLYSGTISAGQHSIAWDGTDSSGDHSEAGLYVYKLQTGDFTALKKLILTE